MDEVNWRWETLDKAFELLLQDKMLLIDHTQCAKMKKVKSFFTFFAEKYSICHLSAAEIFFFKFKFYANFVYFVASLPLPSHPAPQWSCFLYPFLLLHLVTDLPLPLCRGWSRGVIVLSNSQQRCLSQPPPPMAWWWHYKRGSCKICFRKVYLSAWINILSKWHLLSWRGL